MRPLSCLPVIDCKEVYIYTGICHLCHLGITTHFSVITMAVSSALHLAVYNSGTLSTAPYSPAKRAQLPSPRISHETVTKIGRKTFSQTSGIMKRRPTKLTIVPPEGIEYFIKQAAQSYSRGKGILEIFQTSCLLKKAVTSASSSSSGATTTTIRTSTACCFTRSNGRTFTTGFSKTSRTPRSAAISRKHVRPESAILPFSAHADHSRYPDFPSLVTPTSLPSSSSPTTTFELSQTHEYPFINSTSFISLACDTPVNASHDFSLKLGELLASFDQCDRISPRILPAQHITTEEQVSVPCITPARARFLESIEDPEVCSSPESGPETELEDSPKLPVAVPQDLYQPPFMSTSFQTWDDNVNMWESPSLSLCSSSIPDYYFHHQQLFSSPLTPQMYSPAQQQQQQQLNYQFSSDGVPETSELMMPRNFYKSAAASATNATQEFGYSFLPNPCLSEPYVQYSHTPSELQDEHLQNYQMYQQVVDNTYADRYAADSGFTAMPLASSTATHYQVAVMQIANVPNNYEPMGGDPQSAQNMMQMAAVQMPMPFLDPNVVGGAGDCDQEWHSPESSPLESSPVEDSGEEYTDHYVSPGSVVEETFEPSPGIKEDFSSTDSSSSSLTAASKKSKGTKAWTNQSVTAGQHVFLMSQNPLRLAKALPGKKGKYFCSHCPQQYRTILDMTQHMDSALIVRPFHCPEPDCPWHICGFPTASEWCRHTRSQHGKVVMMRCGGCEKRFSRKDSLKRHAVLVHDNSNSRYNRKMRKGAGTKRRKG